MGEIDLIRLIVDHPVITGIICFFALGAFSSIPREARVYTAYLIVIVLAFLWGFQTGNLLYFYAFVIGVLTAFAEIIGKFPDEPIKSLGTIEAVLYHVLNGLIAAFALKMLILFDTPTATQLDRMKIVLAAGLGSMLIMRSKLFNIKVGGEDIAFGPEQIVKVFVGYMEHAIDRARATSRIDFVTGTMDNIDFGKVHDYTLTMLEASQALSLKGRKDLETALTSIKNSTTKSQYKSYELGFLLLNEMGEDFVSRLFEGKGEHLEWLIDPERQRIQPSEGGFLASIGLRKTHDQSTGKKKESVPLFANEESVPLFTYDKMMSEENMRSYLQTINPNISTLFGEKPQHCSLQGYRLDFSGQSNGDPGSERGEANIVEDENAEVEGVLYHMPRSVLELLGTVRDNYQPISVTVELRNGDQVKAGTFSAKTARPDLKPMKDELEGMLRIAEKHKFNDKYIEMLRGLETISG